MHIPEWPGSKTQRYPQPVRTWRRQELSSLLVDCRMGQPLWDRLALPYSAKHSRAVWSGSWDPRCSPNSWENVCLHKSLSQLFIAALFMTAKNWKQPRYPSVGHWISNSRCLHPCTGILFSDKKKGTIKPPEACQNLKWVSQRKRSRRSASCRLCGSHIQCSAKGKLWKQLKTNKPTISQESEWSRDDQIKQRGH